MPIRMVRDWTDSPPVNSISRNAECLFVRLIMKADDFGRFHASPKLLRSLLFPLLIDSVRDAECSRWLLECEQAGLLRVYEADGKQYLEIAKFGQRLKHSRPKFPAPTLPPDTPEPPHPIPETDSGFPEVPGSSRKFPAEGEQEHETEYEQEHEGASKTLPGVAVAWNEIPGVVHVRSMTKTRKAALKSRLLDAAWLASWRDGIRKVSESSFCQGGGDTGWKADLDWFLRPDTLTRLLEGKYDDRDPFAGTKRKQSGIQKFLENHRDGT